MFFLQVVCDQSARLAAAACYTALSQFPVCFLHTWSCRRDWQKAVNKSVFDWVSASWQRRRRRRREEGRGGKGGGGNEEEGLMKGGWSGEWSGELERGGGWRGRCLGQKEQDGGRCDGGGGTKNKNSFTKRWRRRKRWGKMKRRKRRGSSVCRIWC